MRSFIPFLHLASVSRLLWCNFRDFHSQDTSEAKYISMPRRGSSSSVDTIVHDSVERARTRAKSSTPCCQCKKLVSDALMSPSPFYLTTRSRKSTSESFFLDREPFQTTPKNKSDIRKFSSIQDLQNSAKKCPVCSLLWQILRGSDNTLLDQVLKYSNDEFNATSLYLPDGGTDIEELINPGPKVNISASANLEYPGLLQSSPLHASSRRRRVNLQIPRTPTYITPSLRLQLTVAFKAQPGSRQSSNTTVQEELTVFQSSGI
jgi:hypothetical protein